MEISRTESIVEMDQAVKAIGEYSPDLFGKGVERILSKSSDLRLRVKLICPADNLTAFDLMVLRGCNSLYCSGIREFVPGTLHREVVVDREAGSISEDWRSRLNESLRILSATTISIELIPGKKGTYGSFQVPSGTRGEFPLYSGPLLKIRLPDRIEKDSVLVLAGMSPTLEHIGLPLSQYKIVSKKWFHPEKVRRQYRYRNCLIREQCLNRIVEELDVIQRFGKGKTVRFDSILARLGISKSDILKAAKGERTKKNRRYRQDLEFIRAYLSELLDMLVIEGKLQGYEMDDRSVGLRPVSGDHLLKSVSTLPESVNKNQKSVQKVPKSVSPSNRTHSNITHIAETGGRTVCLSAQSPACADGSKAEGEVNY